MIDNLKLELITADVPTVTGRIYPKEVLEHAVEEFNSRKAPCMCDNNAQSGPNITPDDYTTEVKSFELEDNKLFATIKLLDTPAGKVLQKMYNVLGKDRFAFFPTGIGNIKNRKYIADGYVFTGISIRPNGE
jgi:uncharacterized membrane protein